MQADNNKARKKREENEGQEGGITKKQKVANGNGGRGGGEGGRGGGAGGRGAKKGFMELGLGGSEETGDEEEEEVPSHDSSRSSEAERSGDGEGGGLAEPVTT